jgi:hypothetical protein
VRSLHFLLTHCKHVDTGVARINEVVNLSLRFDSLILPTIFPPEHLCLIDAYAIA